MKKNEYGFIKNIDPKSNTIKPSQDKECELNQYGICRCYCHCNLSERCPMPDTHTHGCPKCKPSQGKTVEKKKRYAVLAGDYRQLKMWQESWGELAKDSFYVSDERSYLGKIGFEVTTVGTWVGHYPSGFYERITQYAKTH